ncbi:hypothetical protein, partial [Sphingobium sp. ba1]|uniref:hypothetical protein n=1 Tax=Sphingobium sp. ba1 TaxID=1522072 RepID=UPI001ED98C43
RPQQDYPAATVVEYCSAVLTHAGYENKTRPRAQEGVTISAVDKPVDKYPYGISIRDYPPPPP